MSILGADIVIAVSLTYPPRRRDVRDETYNLLWRTLEEAAAEREKEREA